MREENVMSAHQFLIYYQHMHNSIPIRILSVWICTSSEHEPVTLFLAKTRGEA